jgi:hypothetical protein
LTGAKKYDIITNIFNIGGENERRKNDEKIRLLLSQNKKWHFESTAKLLEIMMQLNEDGFACALQIGPCWNSNDGKNLYFQLSALEVEMKLPQDKVVDMFRYTGANAQVKTERMPHQLLTIDFDSDSDYRENHKLYSRAYDVITRQRGRDKDAGNVYRALITPQSFENLEELVSAFHAAIVLKSTTLEEALKFKKTLSPREHLNLSETKASDKWNTSAPAVITDDAPLAGT